MPGRGPASSHIQGRAGAGHHPGKGDGNPLRGYHLHRVYDEKDQSNITLIKSPAEAVANAGKGWLLVDDLVDTGATMRAARELLPESHVATVYAKPDGMPYVDTFVHEVAQTVWIYFPWDTDLAYTTPMARN